MYPCISKQIAINAVPKRHNRVRPGNPVNRGVQYIFARANCRASIVPKYRHISKSHSIRVEQRMDKAIIDRALSVESSGVTRGFNILCGRITARDHGLMKDGLPELKPDTIGCSPAYFGDHVPRHSGGYLLRVAKFPNYKLIRYKAQSRLAEIARGRRVTNCGRGISSLADISESDKVIFTH